MQWPAVTSGRRALPRTEALEGLLLLAVLALLAWLHLDLQRSAAVAAASRWGLDVALRAPAPPAADPALTAAVCALRAPLPARQAWAWQRACDDVPVPASAAAAADAAGALPALLSARRTALQQTVLAGDAQRRARLAPLARSQAEGVLTPQDAARVAEGSREQALYRQRQHLGPEGSQLLACASDLLAAQTAAAPAARRPVWWSNHAALLLGQPTRIVWPAAEAPSARADGWPAGLAGAGCASFGSPAEAVTLAAAQARRLLSAPQLARKAEAMQTMLPASPWLLAGWALTGWCLLQLARRTRRPARFLMPAALAWAGAGAASAAFGGLVLPDSGLPIPWWAWAAVAAFGIASALLARLPAVERLGPFRPTGGLRPALAWTYPLLVLFVGLGWWMVQDLALNGHLANRYLGQRHAVAVFGALVLVSVLPPFAGGLAGAAMRWGALLTNALRPGEGGRAWLRPALLGLADAVLVLGSAMVLRNWRQLTGEALPLLLAVGAAWFFLLRAGQGWRGLLPLAGHAAVVLLALVLTDDLGPLLVALLAAALYVGAFVAQARGGRPIGSLLLGAGVGLGLAAVLLLGLGLFAQLPLAPAERVAERLASMLDPFSAENDQLAHVLWLAAHTPTSGWGLGTVPWCGTLPLEGCIGVPAQTQSDYSFAAARAIFGSPAAFGLLALHLVWIGLLAARRAAVTEGRLQLDDAGGPGASALAWLAVCWAALAIVQTGVTVAGNLGALPLTGVTWPFVSYGLWSLWRHAGVLGLVMHLPAQAPGPGETP